MTASYRQGHRRIVDDPFVPRPCFLSLLAAPAGRRYVRVSIDRRLTGCQRIAILGHELQHAVEIAESRRVTDDASLADLYRRIGFHSGGLTKDCYDSVGAILAGRTVEKEIRSYAAQAPLR